MLIQPLLTALIVLLLPTRVFSRRGGGGSSINTGSDSDSSHGSDGGGGSDGSSDSSSSSSSSSSDSWPACGNTHLSVDDVVPSYTLNYTSYWFTNDSSTDYDGAFYHGEAFFHYTIGTSTNLTNERCPSGPQSIRMLAVAHIGPQTPYPTGLTNSLVLGFMAWPTNYLLANITESYDTCVPGLDLVRLDTSENFRSWEVNRLGGFDLFDLKVSPAENNRDTVLLDATFSDDIPSIQGFDESFYHSLLRLPKGTCSGRGAVLIGYDNSTVVSGSMSNGMMDLTITGNTMASFDDGSKAYGLPTVDFPVSYNVSFSGVFDGANSARQLRVNQSSSELVSFVLKGEARGFSTRAIITNLWMVYLAMATVVFYQI